MPESRYPICAAVIATTPSAGEGHRKRPFSSRRTYRLAACPSCQITFKRSPRRPRKQKMWPLRAWCAITSSHRRLRGHDPRRHGKPSPTPHQPIASSNGLSEHRRASEALKSMENRAHPLRCTDDNGKHRGQSGHCCESCGNRIGRPQNAPSPLFTRVTHYHND
jgi:hypothetical protein